MPTCTSAFIMSTTEMSCARSPTRSTLPAARAAVQIWHGGFVPEEFFDKTNKLETPDTLTVERIHEIVKQFGYSAKLAVEPALTHSSSTARTLTCRTNS